MHGLQMICKIYGGLTVRDETGTTEYVWDYKQDRAINVKDLEIAKKAEKLKSKEEKEKWLNWKKQQPELFK